jgi:ribonuclease-3
VSSLADAFEAVIGAIYLDSGWDAARVVLNGLFAGEFAGVESTDPQFNPKGELQERLQARGPEPIHYRVETAHGPDHLREFEVSVHHRGAELGRGRGKSKKEAETRAAEEALRRISETVAPGEPSAPATPTPGAEATSA